MSEGEESDAKKPRRKTESDEDFVMDSSSSNEEEQSDSDWEEEVVRHVGCSMNLHVNIGWSFLYQRDPKRKAPARGTRRSSRSSVRQKRLETLVSSRYLSLLFARHSCSI